MTDPIEIMARAIRDIPVADRVPTTSAMKAIEALSDAGYAVVPMMPGKEMVDAAYDAYDAYEAAEPPAAWCGLSSAYSAMIESGKVTA